MLKLIPIGYAVIVGGQDATIKQICIQADNHITYEIVWWNAAERKTAWVDASEIERTGKTSIEIGFHPRKENQ